MFDKKNILSSFLNVTYVYIYGVFPQVNVQ